MSLEKPKVLLPLVGVPMINYTLEWLASNKMAKARPAETLLSGLLRLFSSLFLQDPCFKSSKKLLCRDSNTLPCSQPSV